MTDAFSLGPDPTLVRKAASLLSNAERRRKYRKADYFVPYPSQRKFLLASATYREILLCAPNRTGKSTTGAFAIACHATGVYPSWWTGRRFDRPVKIVCTGITSLETRDVMQAQLCGAPGVAGALGSGMLALDAFADKPTLARGVSDAFDLVQIKHASGGVSTIHFKSSEQGREKFQGTEYDVVWVDEECPPQVYNELLTRLTPDGFLQVTFTPIGGALELWSRYADRPSPDRLMVTMTQEEATHYSPEEWARRNAGYEDYEKEARQYGRPAVGAFLVFKTPEEAVKHTRDFGSIPPHWPWLRAIDPVHAGGTTSASAHAFGCALGAWDRDTNTIYVMDAFRMTGAMPINHVGRMMAVFNGKVSRVRTVAPHDATRKGLDGKSIIEIYRDLGLNMFPEPVNSTRSFEADLLTMTQREANGGLKYHTSLHDLFDERRWYRRKDGLVVREKDDVIDAVRVLVAGIKHARLLDDAAGYDPPIPGLRYRPVGDTSYQTPRPP
jgi:phage terminase large subunit-like protein